MGLALQGTALPLEIHVLIVIFCILQLPAVLVLLARLMQGPRRRSPLKAGVTGADNPGAVSVVVPTLNEANRIRPCLEGLGRQGSEVREVLVVDSHSTDGTQAIVKQYQAADPRFRLLSDGPLPQGWVGRPWALHTGFLGSSLDSDWILGVDADTQPQPGLVSGLVQAAALGGWDLVSLAPKFILKTPGELWLQPALLITLVYRFGPAGATEGSPERVMANGQCFLCRKDLLVSLGGYSPARDSFCDDVTLARHAARQGAKVGFWDGSLLLKVRMYEGMVETWREWGRSLDLKDAASRGQLLWDIWFLWAVQALPWLLAPTLLLGAFEGYLTLVGKLLLGLNAGLIAIRIAMQAAISTAYDFNQASQRWVYWLSPLADVPAFVRILISSLQIPKEWRGRRYDSSRTESDRPHSR